MKEKDPWIKNFRQRLDNYEEPVPADLWEQLEQELNAAPPVLKPLPRVQLMARRWQAVAAVALLLVASTLTVWFWQSPSVDDWQRQSAHMPDLPQRSPLSLLSQESLSSQQGTREVDAVQPVSKRLAVARLFKTFAASVSSQEAEADTLWGQEAAAGSGQGATPDTKRESMQVGTPTADSEKEMPVVSSPSTPRSKYRPWYASAHSGVQSRRSTSAQKWSVGISTGNGSFSSSVHHNGYLPLPEGMKKSVQNNSYGVQVSSEIDKLVQYKNLSEGKDAQSDVDYKMPIVWGASLRLELDANWALETGVTYTLLASETRSGTLKNHYGWKDKLHYVGIPVKVHRRLWNNRWLELYASAGGAVEKCVSGQRTLTGSVSSMAGDSSEKVTGVKQKIDVDPLQWSLSAAAGVQWKWNEQWGLYAEPGMAYYFRDGSGVETIRKAHPFQFHLQLGLRWTFPR